MISTKLKIEHKFRPVTQLPCDILILVSAATQNIESCDRTNQKQSIQRETMEDIEPQDKNQKIVYSVVWALVLLCIAWPLAWFITPVWIFLLPFESILQPGTS
jgi:hypothetical protein